jgi:hypothetical protein
MCCVELRTQQYLNKYDETPLYIGTETLNPTTGVLLCTGKSARTRLQKVVVVQHFTVKVEAPWPSELLTPYDSLHGIITTHLVQGRGGNNGDELAGDLNPKLLRPLRRDEDDYSLLSQKCSPTGVDLHAEGDRQAATRQHYEVTELIKVLRGTETYHQGHVRI